MSEFEANLPGLNLGEETAPTKKAAKKATRKVATKKTARKTAKSDETDTAPVKKAATKKTARKSARATALEAPDKEAPATQSPSAAETDRNSDAKAESGSAPQPDSASRRAADTRSGADRQPDADRERSTRSARAPRNDADEVPMHFSASPDDIDEYGDISERGRRDAAGSSEGRTERNTDHKSEGSQNNHRPARDGGQRHNEEGQQGTQRPQRDNRDRDNRERERDSRDNRERDNRGKGNHGQPGNNKRGHFQKNTGGQQGGGAQGNGNNQHNQQGGNPQANHPSNKSQKFKKGDKFNPNAQQGGGQQSKKARPPKGKPGRKGSWQSQFAAASEEDTQPPVFDGLLDWDLFRFPQRLEAKIAHITSFAAAADPAAISQSAQAQTTGAGTELASPQRAGVTTLAGESLSGSAFAAKTPEAVTPADDRATDENHVSAEASADATDTEADAAAKANAADSDDDADATPVAGEAGEVNEATTQPATPAPTAEQLAAAREPFNYHEAYALKLPELEALAKNSGIRWEGAPQRRRLLESLLSKAAGQKRPILVKGLVELLEDGFGFIVFGEDNYRLRSDSPFIAAPLIQRYGLQRGHEIEALLHPAREGETTPFVLRVDTVMGKTPEEIQHLTPFKELTPYYPTERILLESEQGALGKWDNISMRIVDLLSPIGLGQRGLIVAPPRTGKTVLMQGIANAIRVNRPEARLIILLVDERPEEVTDFRRSVKGAQVVASTFDEAAESHVHAAEMVIEKARRLVEVGEDVIILLDSITRLARAYNTTMPSSGKILSGGVEASALQKPKRFFGSARNIEDGGSLTILGTALVETGSKMDEVIFEEFKGTGNMELHLDRELSNKRVFPALSFEKSGTRKEELLYHPDEMEKVHALRRAMKGVPSTDAMEMLIQRVKRSKTNAQFLMSMAR